MLKFPPSAECMPILERNGLCLLVPSSALILRGSSGMNGLLKFENESCYYTGQDSRDFMVMGSPWAPDIW